MGLPILFARKKKFNPRQLFAAGEQGAWYDPSDFSTMFQDAAGTTPVTGVEQPVGRLLDKSGRGNHASQTTLAARPVLSARYNLLTYTEQFNNAAWNKTNASISPNTTTAPYGPLTADSLVESNVTGRHTVFATVLGAPAGVYYTFSIYLKANTRSFAMIYNSDNQSGGAYLNVNLTTGAFTTGTDGNWANIVGSVFDVGDGWFRCSVSGLKNLGTSIATNVYLMKDMFYANREYQGDGTSGIYIWGADIRVANDGVGLPPYQRVAAATDYDTAGFPFRLNFDRSDDHVTSSAGGGSTTAFFFCAAIRCGAVGATQTIYSDTGTNTGYRIRINSSNQLEMAVGNGSAYTTVNTTATLTLGQRAVITCWHDGTTIYAQIDQGAVASTAFTTATAGTAGFTLGRDNGAASNFFGGTLYEYIHRKDANATDAQRIKAQRYVAPFGKITL